MREAIILSAEHKFSDEMFKIIEKKGHEFKCRIINDPLDDYYDLDLYWEITDLEVHVIRAKLILKGGNVHEDYIINGKPYSAQIILDYDSEVIENLNEILREILKEYPDLYITDEAYKKFDSLKEIENGTAAPWLLM